MKAVGDGGGWGYIWGAGREPAFFLKFSIWNRGKEQSRWNELCSCFTSKNMSGGSHHQLKMLLLVRGWVQLASVRAAVWAVIAVLVVGCHAHTQHCPSSGWEGCRVPGLFSMAKNRRLWFGRLISSLWILVSPCWGHTLTGLITLPSAQCTAGVCGSCKFSLQAAF